MAGSGSALFPAPRQPPARLRRLALGTWHSLPPESRAAQPAGRSSPRQPRPQRRRRQRHLPRAPRNCLGVRRWGGRAGEGERGGASSCSRESGRAVRPAWEPGYGTPGGTRLISRRILARKYGSSCGRRQEEGCWEESGRRQRTASSPFPVLPQVGQRSVPVAPGRLETASAQLSSDV